MAIRSAAEVSGWRVSAPAGGHPRRRAEAYLTTECNWEGCVADYDGLLTWHSLGEGLIPLFPAVYAGLAKTFGCQFNADDLCEEGRPALHLAHGHALHLGGATGLG